MNLSQWTCCLWGCLTWPIYRLSYGGLHLPLPALSERAGSLIKQSLRLPHCLTQGIVIFYDLKEEWKVKVAEQGWTLQELYKRDIIRLLCLLSALPSNRGNRIPPIFLLVYLKCSFSAEISHLKLRDTSLTWFSEASVINVTLLKSGNAFFKFSLQQPSAINQKMEVNTGQPE